MFFTSVIVNLSFVCIFSVNDPHPYSSWKYSNVTKDIKNHKIHSQGIWTEAVVSSVCSNVSQWNDVVAYRLVP